MLRIRGQQRYGSEHRRRLVPGSRMWHVGKRLARRQPSTLALLAAKFGVLGKKTLRCTQVITCSLVLRTINDTTVS